MTYYSLGNGDLIGIDITNVNDYETILDIHYNDTNEISRVILSNDELKTLIKILVDYLK